MNLFRLSVIAATGLLLQARAQVTPLTLTVELLPPTGLTRICDISHCGDERLFLTLQAGTIRIMNPDNTVLATPFLNITDRVNDGGNEQGLLGLAFDPDYANNGYFYVNYTAGSGNGTSRVSRFSVTSDPNVADPASEEILYTVTQPYSNHNGGDIDFGPDGMLYTGFGDGGSGGDPQNNAQTMTTPLGKMLRLDVSGPSGWAVPPDNPFATAVDTLPEIFANGLRNPWRWGFDALTGDLWIGDVGQNAVEEVDFWPAGDLSGPNFGWRCYEANSAYNTSNCQPAAAYVAPVAAHQQTSQGWCSVIGGRVYRGGTYWRLEGRYLYTDYCGGQIYSMIPNGSGGFTRQQVHSTNTVGFSCIGANSANELYMGNNNNGRIYRIREACTEQPPVITPDASTITSSDAIAYQWYLNGGILADETNQTIVPVVSGDYHVIATVNTGCSLSSDTLDFVVTSVPAGEAIALSVRPVPANSELMVEGGLVAGQRIELLDHAGRAVRTERVSGSGLVRLGTGALAEGAYVLQVIGADGVTLARRPVVVAH